MREVVTNINETGQTEPSWYRTFLTWLVICLKVKHSHASWMSACWQITLCPFMLPLMCLSIDHV